MHWQIIFLTPELTMERKKFFSRIGHHTRPFAAVMPLIILSKKYCKLAGVEKKPRRAFHSVRRSFATELSLKGIPLGEISELLGHRSLRLDKPYLSYNKNIAFVAGDFSEIPITDGIYTKILKTEESAW